MKHELAQTEGGRTRDDGGQGAGSLRCEEEGADPGGEQVAAHGVGHDDARRGGEDGDQQPPRHAVQVAAGQVQHDVAPDEGKGDQGVQTWAGIADYL